MEDEAKELLLPGFKELLDDDANGDFFSAVVSINICCCCMTSDSAAAAMADNENCCCLVAAFFVFFKADFGVDPDENGLFLLTPSAAFLAGLSCSKLNSTFFLFGFGVMAAF